MTESEKISETDNMGREKFWEDLGRPENDGLALKVFQSQCCENCLCAEQKQCYNRYMTEETKPEETYTGFMCCAACTCTNPHRSAPSETEE